MTNLQEDPFIIIKSYNREELFSDFQVKKERKATVHSWTEKENILYLSFLKENLLVMESKEHRKSVKIFKQMEKVIITRKSVQIKSHHQKLLNKYKEIRAIIFSLEKQLLKKSKKDAKPATRDAQTSVELKVQSSEPAYETYDSFSYNQRDISKTQLKNQIFFDQQEQSFIRIPFQAQNWDQEPLI